LKSPKEKTMFARTPAFRAAALFVSAVLTAVMLGGIDGLATAQHADATFAKAAVSAQQG
jgi:hypothetical protein